MRVAVAQAQDLPQEVDPRHLRHLLRAIDQVAQLEVGTEAELVREPGQALFQRAEERVVGAQVIDDEDLALRPADAVQLLEQARRALYDRDHVHRHHLVEARVGERHLLGVHLEQRRDVRELAAFHPGARLVEHLGRHVDAGDARMRRMKRQRQPGAHADLEHALARLAAERLDDGLAARLKDGAEQRVVDARVAAVRRLDGLDLHPGDYYRHGFELDGGGFRLAAAAEGRRGREARPAACSNEYRRQAWRLRPRQAEWSWRLQHHLERP